MGGREGCVGKTWSDKRGWEAKPRKTHELNGVVALGCDRCILFLRCSLKSPRVSYMPRIHSPFPSVVSSFRPLRNMFRSIDFAVDTQAVGSGAQEKPEKRARRGRNGGEAGGRERAGVSSREGREGRKKKKAHHRGNEIAK